MSSAASQALPRVHAAGPMGMVHAARVTLASQGQGSWHRAWHASGPATRRSLQTSAKSPLRVAAANPGAPGSMLPAIRRAQAWSLVPWRRGVTSLGKTQGRIVVIGSGWAGFQFLRRINTERYEVICVSPRNYFVFTPLLASSAVGTLEFRAIIEPVRQFRKPIQYQAATCDSIDFAKKTIRCTSTLGDGSAQFDLAYDKLVIAPGARSNTFGIEGVTEHALFLKDIEDAKRIRRRVIDCFERAMQPNISEEEQLRLLHFQTVGGGPTGVEFSAELHDFIMEDLSKLYPQLMSKVQMTLHDVAPRILGSFDEKLAEYATKIFSRGGVHVRTNSRVKKVEKDHMIINDAEKMPYGLLVWATGITQVPLIRSLESSKQTALDPKNTGRILTDNHLRVIDKDGKAMQCVYALGDCATIKGNDLPATAQVANQKAIYLSRQLNKVDKLPVSFEYKNMGSMAYIGGWRAVADLPDYKPSGFAAWIFWRSAYLSLSVSWRNKCLIPMYWFAAWAFGRDVSRI